MSLTSLMHPMTDRPTPGTRVLVFMQDGTIVECSVERRWFGEQIALWPYGVDGEQKTLDETSALGWLHKFTYRR